MRRSLQYTLIILLCGVLIYGLVPAASFAQQNNISAAEEARLRKELKKLEEEIARQKEILNVQRGRSSSIERDVSVLRAEIEKARSVIRQQNIQINQLDRDIQAKNSRISTLQSKLSQHKRSLGQLLQRDYEIDQANVVHVMLSNQSLSEFYTDVNTFTSLKQKIQHALDEIRRTQKLTKKEKEELREKKNQELNAKKKAERQKEIVEKSEQEKQRLLSISRNKEQQYQAILKERKAEAAKIRAALFNLRDSGPIPFGDAYEYAKVASQRTGVRPALILAILKQESNLGANVGTCYLKNPNTGSGVRINSNTEISRVMKPERDVAPFMRITEKLGRDPFSTRVSCPWRIGYGGAMGPSQFIPSTWEIFDDRIARIMGSTANPWNPQHAITATALYLHDLGAHRQTFNDEREAACRYYSGVSCYHPTVQNMFYGNSVMELAKDIQADIDVLESV